ncbi:MULTISPECIES: hypothetical protein [Pirellulaceae]|uniref:hypothetical protein n=1 Tax=Pirellulaceae TaxID=2691357 RepID=UPI0011B0A799|nr:MULTISPECIES: hypothetical protein [Pirellulaceae]
MSRIAGRTANWKVACPVFLPIKFDQQETEIKRLKNLLTQPQPQPHFVMLADKHHVPADTAPGLNPLQQRGPLS